MIILTDVPRMITLTERSYCPFCCIQRMTCYWGKSGVDRAALLFA